MQSRNAKRVTTPTVSAARSRKHLVDRLRALFTTTWSAEQAIAYAVGPQQLTGWYR